MIHSRPVSDRITAVALWVSYISVNLLPYSFISLYILSPKDIYLRGATAVVSSSHLRRLDLLFQPRVPPLKPALSGETDADSLRQRGEISHRCVSVGQLAWCTAPAWSCCWSPAPRERSGSVTGQSLHCTLIGCLYLCVQ